MSLWLCLRFPRLALECQASSEERPLALVERQRLLQVNDTAAALGLAPGQGVATARALAGDELQLLARDRGREADSLEELCCWAYGITPVLHRWREDCLLLEIGGCLRLFGGLTALLGRVDRGLAQRALSYCRGIAPTPKAAWLLSFAGEPAASALEQPLEERLAPLPLARLAVLLPALGALEEAGLARLGDVLALPERALGRRCGREAVALLQQVTGRAHDRQPAFQPPLRFRARHRFGYEVTGSEELQPAIRRLLDALVAFLRNTQQQTGTLHWHFIGARGQRQALTVRASAETGDAATWAGLIQTRLERYPLAGGVETLVLRCDELAPATPGGGDLFAEAGAEPLASLRDRLRNRLGQQAIRHLACRSEHLPERATATSAEPAAGSETACGTLRPFWLMPEPVPLRAGGDGSLHGHGRLVLLHGPERIEDNWWEAPVSRDYFVAEGRDGGRYWVFRDRRRDRWYLQGVFS
ncbi:MAG: Y-family DNA polymerase [Pseudohaliea sp.]